MLNANPEKQGLLKQKTRPLAGLPIRCATPRVHPSLSASKLSDYRKQVLTIYDTRLVNTESPAWFRSSDVDHRNDLIA